jgi:HSP20 family protein
MMNELEQNPRTLSRREQDQQWLRQRSGSASPFALLREMTEWMDQAFQGDQPVGRGERGWTPAVEVREQDNKIVVCADLPGIEQKDVKVEVDENVLVIQGERKRESAEDREGLRRSERFYGTFYRAIALPENAKLDNAKAEFKNGVLEVTVPVDQSQMNRRQIPIAGAQTQTARK